MNVLTAIPAYGKDYKSKKEVLSAWKDKKDFEIVSLFMVNQSMGRYFNINESELIKNVGVTHINIRYKKMTQVAVIKL